VWMWTRMGITLHYILSLSQATCMLLPGSVKI
jgi:hypothetical protein